MRRLSHDKGVLRVTWLTLFLPELVFYAHRKTTATPILSAYGKADVQIKDTNRTRRTTRGQRKRRSASRSTRVRVLQFRAMNQHAQHSVITFHERGISIRKIIKRSIGWVALFVIQMRAGTYIRVVDKHLKYMLSLCAE